jgi:hypothetical protein
MNQSWILQVRLAFVAGMRPDTRPVSHYGRWYLDLAEKRQRSGHIYQVANPISMRLTFSLPLSFTSGTASLSHRVSPPRPVQPLLWTERLVQMAFVCVQLKTNNFPSRSLFNCGAQPSKIPALEGVYLF